MTDDELVRRFELDVDAELPDLSAYGVPGRLERTEVTETSFDTEEGRLAAAGIALVRRTDGPDPGWWLSGPGLPEETAPLGAGRRPPAALLRRVRAYVRDRPLRPGPTVRTVRELRRLLDPAGAVLLILDDLRHPETGRRDVEVRATPEGRDAAAAVETALFAIGARPRRAPEAAADGSAGAVVLRYVDAQVEAILTHDALVRTDAPDAVHQMRVGTRRLRTTLATFRPLLDRAVTDPVRDELRWLAGRLGPVRDDEVLRARLARLLADDDADASIRRQVDRALAASRRANRRELLAALDSERYFRLLDALDTLRADPPYTAKARKAPRTLRKPARRSWRHTVAAVAAAGQADATERIVLLHEARKKAKRARYAAEAVEPALGRTAERVAGRMKKVQTVLGHAQDSVVSAARLGQLRYEVDDAFALGRVQAQEEQLRAAELAAFERVWKRAVRRTY